MYKSQIISKSFTKKIKIDNNYDIISIGQIYSNFTKILGFRENCDEGKVEALAAYGQPIKEIVENLNKIIFINKEHSYFFDSEPLEYKIFFSKKNIKKYLNTHKRENIAASIQFWLEELVTNFVNLSLPENKKVNLCLAGGVFSNVILNYKIYEKCKIKNLFICPAMGDDGSALGSAILAAIEKI